MSRNLNFESKVRSLVNLVRVLVGCNFLYIDFDDRVVETVDDYKLNTGSGTAGKLVRLWNNSCVTSPDDYDIQINNIDSIITSSDLDTSVFVIRKEDVIYNAIPLACTSLSGVQLYSVYENDGSNTAHFQRLVDVLNLIFTNEYAYDPNIHMRTQEHMVIRCFKAQVILALALKYALPDSNELDRYTPEDVINLLTSINYGGNNFEALAEVFKSSIQEIFGLTKQMTFVEIIRYLFEENALVKYYRQMSQEIYKLEHPRTVLNPINNQNISAPSSSTAKETTETFETKMEGAFNNITAKAKVTRLKDRKMSVAVEDSSVPNTRMFA